MFNIEKKRRKTVHLDEAKIRRKKYNSVQVKSKIENGALGKRLQCKQNENIFECAIKKIINICTLPCIV